MEHGRIPTPIIASYFSEILYLWYSWVRRGRDRVVLEFIDTCAISAYHRKSSSNLVHGEVYSIQHYVIVCQWFPTGRWFSQGTPVTSTNNRHDIVEILLKVALSTINQTKPNQTKPIVFFDQ